MERVDRFIRNPHGALLRLTGPFLVSMIVQVLYNLVDTIYVGRIGPDALAAITFAFPILFMLISINSGIGIGMRSRVSRSLGAKDTDDAEITATHGLAFALCVAVVIILIGMGLMEPLFELFGASENVGPLAQEYLSVILLAAIFMFTSGIFNNIFSAQGDTTTPMYITVTSLVANIILDPIFIFGLDMGVRGAAFATLISFALATALFVFAFRIRSQLGFRFKNFSIRWDIITEILRIGIPTSLSMVIISVYFMFINRFMAVFSMDHVATFGIVARLESVIMLPMAALGMSLVTLVGMFYGAKEYDKMTHITWTTFWYSVGFSIVIGIIMFIWPGAFIRIFTPDQHIIELGITYMRLNVFTFPAMAITVTTSRAMQAVGHGLPGLVVNAVRILVCAVPLGFFFIYIAGYPFYSVAVAGIIGGVIASIVGTVWLRVIYARCRNSTTASA